MNNPYAIGKRIYLRAPTVEDLEGRWHEWFSDPETTQYLIDRFWPNTIELQKEFFQSIQHSQNRLVLSIIDQKTGEHIGVCNLSAINWIHRFADIALVIGEKKYRDGQRALETVSLLLQIAFLRLNLLNLKGGFIESNPLTELIVKIFDFEIVGRDKNLFFFKGNYVDLVHVQLSREKWLDRNPKAIQVQKPQ